MQTIPIVCGHGFGIRYDSITRTPVGTNYICLIIYLKTDYLKQMFERADVLLEEDMSECATCVYVEAECVDFLLAEENSMSRVSSAV